MALPTVASAVVIATICLAPLGAGPAEVQSPGVVQQLIASMNRAGLSAIAARDPEGSGHYVAAMLFPGVQLLVIRAQTTTADYIESELAAGRHDAVYAALHQGIPASKLFVQDMGADGIRGAEGGLADVVYRRGIDQHILNGDHKAAKLSAAKYATLIGELDREYTRLLELLLASANARGSGSAGR